MTYYLTKIAITTLLVVLVSEAAKRSVLLGAVLASMPIVSVLAMLWLYVDTKDAVQVAQLRRCSSTSCLRSDGSSPSR